MAKKKDEPAAGLPPTVVAEVSKNWEFGPNVPPPARECLCGLFEECIEFNRKRGYSLDSWRLSQLLTSPTTMTETIIAVFARGKGA